ncbi:hypothetical protein shim_01020 [Shimia sp. SK013]|uniref:DUF2652 domain-containing protein n=2 Tax=unclassified Shimia TaxID=2630038 RepID=UPI0006B63B10|nr:DUF2652 domain-containing protein [Shimia sp. SK013]KPA23494.1 hypothetical protein shim_01020 [Shimia sp. SK013]
MAAKDNGVKTAYFVIADISGYTKFMAETPIEHAKGILESLFGDLVPAIRAPLEVSGLQGDAVFAYAFESDVMTKQFILDFAEQLYCVFARSKEKIILNTSCPCDACANVRDLELKVVVHHGECVIQETGGREELAGQDVITAFRLLKNSVKERTGLNAYALISCDALRSMDMADLFDDSDFHSEDIEHIGQVEYVVRDMRKAWERRRTTERTFVESSEDLLLEEWMIPLPVSPELAFTIATRPDLRAEWIGADQVDLLNTNKGKIEPGTTYHCHHGDEIFPYEIVDWNPGDYVTGRYNLPMGLSMLETMELVEMGDGTMVKLRFAKPKSGKLMGKIMNGMVQKKLKSIIVPDKENRISKMTALGKKIATETAPVPA